MLHGHTKIELKDEKTGEVQVVEKDNMITNAMASILGIAPTIFSTQELNSEFFPLNNLGIGGILLFQESLDESVNNTIIPSEEANTIIGYASNDINSGTDTKRGSRNLTESAKLDNGYKFVWDFTTSQANGQISSLGLTHAGTGKNPLSSNILGGNNSIEITKSITQDLSETLNLYVCDFDWDSNIITAIQTIDATHIKISKIKLYTGNINVGVNDTLRVAYLISEVTKELPQSIKTDTYWCSSDDDYYYGYGGGGYSTNEAYMLVRINKSDYTMDEGFTFNNRTAYSYMYPSAIKIVWKNCFYICSKNIGIVKIDLNTKQSSHLSNGSYALAIDRRGFLHAGTVFVKSDFTAISRNLSLSFFTDVTGSTNEKFVSINPDNNVVISIQGNSSYGTYYTYIQMGVLREYLATINNLDTPVIKTSEQSMKITYTITEE